MNNRNQAFYLSHGGGPLPILGDKGHLQMVTCLQEIAKTVRQPDAIIVISAHWEESKATITSGPYPQLIYDYSGFSPESYQIQYPCPGDPELAQQLDNALKANGIESRLDEQRGFDHGLFIPLKIMYPQANIPCIELSLLTSLSAAQHIQLGKALQHLANRNLLIIGSGFSFHNMRAFFVAETAESKQMNAAFEGWLIETCTDPELSEDEREQRLIQWETAPHARYCHPREEHLLPLHVCYGFAQKPCTHYFKANILGKKSSMYLWES